MAFSATGGAFGSLKAGNKGTPLITKKQSPKFDLAFNFPSVGEQTLSAPVTQEAHAAESNKMIAYVAIAAIVLFAILLWRK